MIERKLFSLIEFSNWPAYIHIGLITEMRRVLNNTFDEDVPAPAKLQPYLAVVLACIAKELQDYDKEAKSQYTPIIEEADKRRDTLLNQLLAMVAAMLKMDDLPAKKQAAETLNGPLSNYKPSAKMALDEETTQLQQWYEVYNASPEQQAAAAELGLTQIISEMMAQNDIVVRNVANRDAEKSAKKEIQMSDDRKATDEALRDFAIVLNACVIFSDDAHEFDSLVQALQDAQTRYLADYQNHQRQNKRIIVKSDITVNHQYKGVAGWTWARLVEDYPKLLALDPAPSKPGEDPVIVPLRVISAEQKAIKAGGRAVALAGRLVKPTDELNFEKDYELVPYAE